MTSAVLCCIQSRTLPVKLAPSRPGCSLGNTSAAFDYAIAPSIPVRPAAEGDCRYYSFEYSRRSHKAYRAGAAGLVGDHVADHDEVTGNLSVARCAHTLRRAKRSKRLLLLVAVAILRPTSAKLMKSCFKPEAERIQSKRSNMAHCSRWPKGC